MEKKITKSHSVDFMSGTLLSTLHSLIHLMPEIIYKVGICLHFIHEVHEVINLPKSEASSEPGI